MIGPIGSALWFTSGALLTSVPWLLLWSVTRCRLATAEFLRDDAERDVAELLAARREPAPVATAWFTHPAAAFRGPL